MQGKAQVTRDTVVASASVQRTPRVGIVLSSYKGGSDHFGNATFEGLPEPRGAGEELTAAQISALTRHAISLGNHPNRGLSRIMGGSESVLLLASRYVHPVVVSTVAAVVREHAPSARIAILSDDAKKFTGGAVLDLAAAERTLMPAPGIWSRRDVEYRVPKILLECDRLITIAPFRIEGRRPSLAIDNYRMLGSDEESPPDLLTMDLYGFHPAEFAVVGGTHVLTDGRTRRHNLVLAGPLSSAVDAVGSAVLNIAPEQVSLLQLASKRGFGDPSLELVWTMGNEIDEARLTS